MLTPRQHDMLSFIVSYIRQKGKAPTGMEMAKAVGLKSVGSIGMTLLELVELGFIQHRPCRPRDIQVLRLPVSVPNSAIATVPLAERLALDDFHNRLRIMVGIDMHELVEAGAIAANDRNAWESFRLDPYRFFIRADDDTAAKIWSVIERRATKRVSHD